MVPVNGLVEWYLNIYGFFFEWNMAGFLIHHFGVGEFWGDSQWRRTSWVINWSTSSYKAVGYTTFLHQSCPAALIIHQCSASIIPRRRLQYRPAWLPTIRNPQPISPSSNSLLSTMSQDNTSATPDEGINTISVALDTDLSEKSPCASEKAPQDAASNDAASSTSTAISRETQALPACIAPSDLRASQALSIGSLRAVSP